MINRQQALPLGQQCRILALSRASLDYTAVAVSQRYLPMKKPVDLVHPDDPE